MFFCLFSVIGQFLDCDCDSENLWTQLVVIICDCDSENLWTQLVVIIYCHGVCDDSIWAL